MNQSQNLRKNVTNNLYRWRVSPQISICQFICSQWSKWSGHECYLKSIKWARVLVKIDQVGTSVTWNQSKKSLLATEVDTRWYDHSTRLFLSLFSANLQVDTDLTLINQEVMGITSNQLSWQWTDTRWYWELTPGSIKVKIKII